MSQSQQHSDDNMSLSPPNCDVHLHAEIELLKQHLVDKQSQLIAMETACLRESDRQVELEDSIIAWQDKYDRLYESHKRVQKVNQGLEDKLLKLVDRHSNERAQLTSDVATLSVRLAQANYNIATVQREIERYRTDMALAIQLLQCKPDSFISQKVTSLPLEMQSKVTQYMRLDTQSHSDSEGSLSGIGVATSGSYRVLPASDSPPPMCPFPPTAMVYSMRGLDDESGLGHSEGANNSTPTASVNGLLAASGQNHHHHQHHQQQQRHHHHHHHHSDSSKSTNHHSGGAANGICTTTTSTSIANATTNAATDMISPSLMARYLQDELKASEQKHCDSCVCASAGRDLTVLALTESARTYTVGTQTHLHGENAHNALCLRCNSNLNSPSRTNSPYIMKLVKSSDSVISETKSSYSGSLAALDMTGYVERAAGSALATTTTMPHSVLLTPQRQQQQQPPATTTVTKKDDLTVNPILGHHRLCDRKSGTAGKQHREQSALAAAAAAAASVELQIENELRGLSSKQTAAATAGKTTAGSAAKMSPMYGDVSHHHHQQQQQHLQSTDTASGSNSSLWSKSSSSNVNNNQINGNVEGAKMFENFNRNLIKSIKSENPKVAGPRLCALRIQNGSTNILLDNIDATESTADNGGVTTPVMYTRRPRFLDEELDEHKDVITSPSRPAVAATETLPTTAQGTATATTLLDAAAPPSSAIPLLSSATAASRSKTGDFETCLRDVSSSSMSGRYEKPPTGTLQKDLLSGSSMSISTTTNDRSPQLEPIILSPIAVQHSQQSQQLQQQHAIVQQQQQQQQLHQHQHMPIALHCPTQSQQYNNHPQAHHRPSHMLSETTRTSSANRGGSVTAAATAAALPKTGPLMHVTSNEADAQESAILRRQQLSRVAEWVQNNHLECVSVSSGGGATAVSVNGSGEPGFPPTVAQAVGRKLSSLDQRAMLTTNSNASAATSIDSGYKTKAPPRYNNNSGPMAISGGGTNTTASNAGHELSSSLSDHHKLDTSSVVVVVDMDEAPIPTAAAAYAQSISNNNINNVVGKSQACEKRISGDGCPTGTSTAAMADAAAAAAPVDFAQMEYNVKQFLLKQNEWSGTMSALQPKQQTHSGDQVPAHRTETNL